MLKTYQKFIIKDFIIKYLIISITFLFLIITLGILEEITFLKNIEKNFLLPYFLTFLNAPITLFEIFPFIFLLTTQYLFLDLFRNEELTLLKINGLSNIKILSLLFFISVLIGIFNTTVIYNIASKFKFHYSNIKNELSNDNKYLAMVTDSGLWIKDEINENVFIIKSNLIQGDFLKQTIINEFDKNFELVRTIQSPHINITDTKWIIFNPVITKDNIKQVKNSKILLETNFNKDKITNLFSNISTLAILELFDLKSDFEKLGYSSREIDLHLLELFTLPIFCGILSLISGIIMFQIKNRGSSVFIIIFGILASVLIYYINFLFISLGINGKIPVLASVTFPMVLLSLLSLIFLIRINEK
ncbi:LptF/LptG family permease [Candidatus Pelagibacter communis]|uniref:LptF/LptG family permease n=1 Tax=Candidatus Pelagibacter TaxID=198251 RepID=UPI003EDEE43B